MLSHKFLILTNCDNFVKIALAFDKTIKFLI